MHLINTKSVTLEYFQNGGEVPYGILSHRWEHEEITHQDMYNGSAESKYGYQKVLKACEQARKDGLDYMWVDTCCIDKTSSAELSEAINSMFAWYYNAQVCYVYLSDVTVLADLEQSVWFTRGWTLQELIAPQRADFFTCDWTKLGTKAALGLKLSQITSVPEAILNGREKLTRLSVAQRMSWAAQRRTTRPEDRAYSLLGLFEINMPLLYGEGNRAFIRLQQEIISSIDDHSIFAWHYDNGDSSDGDNNHVSGLLAESPEAFTGCSSVARRAKPFELSTFSMTNRGLSISLPLLRWSYNTHLALLNCVEYDAKSPTTPYTLGIFVRQLEESQQYARVTLLGQDHVLYDSSCFLEEGWDEEDKFKFDMAAAHASLRDRSSKKPVICRPMEGHRYRSKCSQFEPTNVFVRNRPMGFSDFRNLNLYGFKIGRFTPFPKDSDLNPTDDLAIRCWNIWDPKERYSVIQDSLLGDACRIYVQAKAIKKPADLSTSTSDAETTQEQELYSIPSMWLSLGFRDFEEYDPVMILCDNPPEDIVTSMISDPRSDAEVLNEPPSKDLSDGYYGSRRCSSKYRQLFERVETTNGVKTRIVDVLWCGAWSRCDECGEIMEHRQYCCLSCSYDCCRDCFQNISKTRHDAVPENREHHFWSTRLNGSSVEDMNRVESSRLWVMQGPMT